MAKKVGNTKGSLKDIQSIECFYNFSVKGNAHQFPCSEVSGQMIDDYRVYLSDKEFLEKYADKIPNSFDEADYSENGMADEFSVTQEYYVTFKDGSEIYIDFSLPDYDFQSADVRDYDESKGKMAEKWLPEYSKDKWNMSIDELEEEISGKKLEKGGTIKSKDETITVTEKNIDEFDPYQGQNKKLTVGDVLYIVKKGVPSPTRNFNFAIVTDWEPSENSLKIAERANDPEAEKYGWKSGSELTKKMLKEKKESYLFNRWSINEKFLSKKLEDGGTIKSPSCDSLFGDGIWLDILGA